MNATRTVLERFEDKYTRGGPDECWEWRGARKPSGHGNFGVGGGRFVVASNYSLALATGGRPDGMNALHSCDNPPCVNPAHLRWGTKQDNSDDARARGRIPQGEARPKTILTARQVIEIRERYAAGETTKALEVEFGLRYNSAQPIVNGKNWRHVGGPITHKRKQHHGPDQSS